MNRAHASLSNHYTASEKMLQVTRPKDIGYKIPLSG